MEFDQTIAGKNKSPATASSSSLRLTYTLTILVSACLLFLVQPLFAKMSLPLLGGTPAVWAIAMCFFQGVLLVGYAYAHLLRKFATPFQSVLVHSCVLFLAASMLPFTAPVSAEPINGLGAGLVLLGLYTKSIGFPFFALSATAPLLQSWFARTTHPQAANPYFLYAASNIGSMGALFLYPIGLEPFFGLSAQTNVWTICFSFLVVLITIAGHQHLHTMAPTQSVSSSTTVTESITAGRRIYWVVMASVPSALLVGWTNYLTSDITSAPFLWLPPLVMFLFTFVLEFRDNPPIPGKVLALAQGISLPVVLAFQYAITSANVLPVIVAGAISFFASALICHRQLYNSRPPASQLTEFYMLMSVGGVLGGLFVSIIAPVLFTTTIEYPLLLVAATLLRANPGDTNREFPANLRVIGETLVAFALIFVALKLALPHLLNNPLELAVLASIPFAFYRAKLVKNAVLAAVALPLLLGVGRLGEIATFRNYFGVLGVANSDDNVFRLLRHGTTLHGAQYLKDIQPSSTGTPVALTYYNREGGMARSLLAKQDVMQLQGKTANVGIVGLGSGAFACYRKQAEKWTYFEIDPEVVRVAKDPQYFTYLSKCGSDMKIVEGDARLTIQQQPKDIYDFLLIDAFSSDSIPAHLLTAEAVKIYSDHIKNDGIIVFHLSNRFMDLVPFVISTVDSTGLGFENRFIFDNVGSASMAKTSSVVVVISRDKQTLEVIDRELGRKIALKPDGTAPWTDDFTNAPAAIWRKFTNPSFH